jgi:hypothetical protein
MSNATQQNVLDACLAPSVYEKGGGYGQKGVDFQRYWAISRIIELASTDEPDFLILFESLQDIMELNHPESPTSAKVYQLKMKESGEWTWKSLTALPVKPRKKRNSNELTTPLTFTASPIGKLASSVAELGPLSGEGYFVSNLGCNAELQNGSTAGTVRMCKFSDLSEELRNQISPEIQKLKKAIPLDALHLHRSELSLEDPDTHVTGKVHNYLLSAAPQHAGQCKSFSDSLFAVLSKRGRRTDPPADFATLVSTRGYSRSDFVTAVHSLKSTPDHQGLVNTWLGYLRDNKMPPAQLTKLQIRLTQLLQSRLQTGEAKPTPLDDAAKEWIASNPVGDDVLEFVRNGASALAAKFPDVAADRLQAKIVLGGISQCLNQT